MSDEKIDVSRRRFFTGAFKRMREGRAPIHQPIAQSSGNRELLKEAQDAYSAEDYETASKKYNEFVRQESDNAEARQQLAQALYLCGKTTQAKVELKRILYSDKQNNKALLWMGLTLCKSGKPEKALDYWKEYFDTSNIPLFRELNLQKARLESGEELTGTEIAEAVEQVLFQEEPPAEDMVKIEKS
ncbi:MAG: tetratricopeptide repeat protein [Desulfovibrio sp.]